MNVIISGLTAAGKTTHCGILRDRFGLQRIAAADALMRLGGIDSSLDSADSRLWLSPEAQRLTQLRRSSTALDVAVDQELTKLCDVIDNVVFDAWALPWLASGPVIKIWLESSPESRLMKSIVSHELDCGLTAAEIFELLQRKDQEARDLFLSLYGFDIFQDRSVFDLVVNTSSFISEPTQAASHSSVVQVDAIVSNFVGWRLARGDKYRLAFLRQWELHPDQVVWVGSSAHDAEWCA